MAKRKTAGQNSGKGKAAKKGKRGGRGGQPPGDGARAPGRRQQLRQEARQAREGKRHHGGEDARAETRQRLRAKALERKLARLAAEAPAAERSALLRELGQVHMEGRRAKSATEAFQQVLDLQPQDPDFVRTPLLCLLMDQARSQEASDLLKGPLFGPSLTALGAHLGAGATAADAVSAVAATEAGTAAGTAVTCACYTLALLTYISVKVLAEHGRNPNKAAAAEQKLASRLNLARKRNPYVAEFVAFAPAFEPHFPIECDLPPASSCTPAELPLLEAVEYCCRYRQAAVWLDTDEEVRRFLRCMLFEEDDEEGEGADGEEVPPFGPLPAQAPGESALLARWRRAREAALELWATEMSVEGGSDEEDAKEDGGEEGGEEGESSMDSSEALAALEESMDMG